MSTIHTTYSAARAQLARFLNDVVDNNEIVIINRRGSKDVAMIAASELVSLMETAHLLRSPKNAERLLKALKRAKTRAGSSKGLSDLRKELGFEDP